MMDDQTPAAAPTSQLRAIAAEVMTIDDVRSDEVGGRRVESFHGRLTRDSQAAYAYVGPRFREQGYTALLREERQGVALVGMPGVIEAAPSRLWVALLLFALTVVSTTFVGGLTATGFDLGLGLAFSGALMTILLSHEMGHYLVARRFGVAVSYPFFIPMPIFLLGTMGAFISIKEPLPNRKTLLAIGIAGPLAGLVVTIPLLLLGLNLSEVQPIPSGEGYFTEGNSLLYALAKYLVFGQWLPSNGVDVFIHPVALAGWAGVLLTGLNLLPAGQLDGGHIAVALLGPRIAQWLTIAIAGLMVVLGFQWNGWFLWAIIIALFGLQRTPLLDEVTPLRGTWRLLALLGLLVFAITFTPVPIS
jgi:Zn-dependent protease